MALNGFLRGGFTGAVAGQASAALTDRDSFCSGSYDPACYFQERLPGAFTSVPFEYGLLSAQWAGYRSGAGHASEGLAVSDCDVMPGCVVDDGRCREQRCAYASTAESCDGVPVCVRLSEDACDAETLCSWNGSTCNSAQCSNYGSESACESDAGCAFIDGSGTDFPGRYCKAHTLQGQTVCEADPRCHWYEYGSFQMCVSQHCSTLDNQVGPCEADARCSSYYYDFCVDEITVGDAVECEWRPES